MKTKIRLLNIQFYGWHGVLDIEKDIGQRFDIDIEYSISDNLDICSDKINQTVDYKSIYKNVSFKFFEKKI